MPISRRLDTTTRQPLSLATRPPSRSADSKKVWTIRTPSDRMNRLKSMAARNACLPNTRLTGNSRMGQENPSNIGDAGLSRKVPIVQR